MARPAPQRLLAEIEGRRIDIVLVYKVARPTRSPAGSPARAGRAPS
jgi:DNA invertase Pin-like site-specific DNA recombinase